ncbi:MAG: hypothetical protein JRG71_02530 [Deltaproteobacteria bacterium]|nr:hypothetical protein [Deltaproteobacteria bacterium]
MPLSEFSPDIFGDSYISQQSIQQNSLDNIGDTHTASFIDSTEKLDEAYDVVILKVPKSQALLEDQLYRIKKHITAETIIIAAGMVKAVHRSTLKLFESIIGSTTTSLARKKARLIFSHVDTALIGDTTPYPNW